MSLSLFIPTINELSALLVLSHASNGGTVLLSRNNKIWNNLSAKSIINAYHPEPHARIIQTSLLELCKSGDGCKWGAFIAISLLRSFHRHYGEVHPLISLTKTSLKRSDFKANSMRSPLIKYPRQST
jgi:hypothetical protein